MKWMGESNEIARPNGLGFSDCKESRNQTIGMLKCSEFKRFDIIQKAASC
jgi:hypothetical protein